MRILLTGGGTGGHITPIIAVARELKKIAQEKRINNLELFYVGPNGFSNELLKSEEIQIKTILSGKLRRYFSSKNILDIFKMPIGFFQALWNIFYIMPDVCFGKGGYGSFLTVLACWIFRIPVLLHESDTIPGLSNRFLSRFAKRIAISFSVAEKFFPKKKVALVGNPIRIEITQGLRDRAGETLGLVGGKPVIFIFGGSQGSQPINEIILNVLQQLAEKCEIIWQTGKDNFGKISAEAKERNVTQARCHIFAFMDEKQVADAFAVSYLVISRAGAANIFEIAACAKPSILIPLPESASNHQKENAFEYAKKGATVVLEQANLTPNLFLGEISLLFNNPGLLQKMSDSARSFARPEAAQKIVEELIKLAR